jgi:hypothetical protein
MRPSSRVTGLLYACCSYTWLIRSLLLWWCQCMWLIFPLSLSLFLSRISFSLSLSLSLSRPVVVSVHVFPVSTPFLNYRRTSPECRRRRPRHCLPAGEVVFSSCAGWSTRHAHPYPSGGTCRSLELARSFPLAGEPEVRLREACGEREFNGMAGASRNSSAAASSVDSWVGVWARGCACVVRCTRASC